MFYFYFLHLKPLFTSIRSIASVFADAELRYPPYTSSEHLTTLSSFFATPLEPMLRHLVQYLWQSFLQLNLFKTSSSDANTAPKEHIATRLYLCSLALAVLIIAIVAASLLRTVNTTEYSPRQTRFSYLANKYPDTLFCPCSTIGISYGTFVSTHVRFHQVCSSQFVQQAWIDMIFTQQNNASFSPDDVRNTLSFFWQVIAGLCKISNTTWFDIVAGFNASYTFSPVAVTEQVMRSQAQVALDNAIYSVRTKLTRDLLAIRRIMSGNQVVSALATNFYARYPPINGSSRRFLKMSPRLYDNCSCLHSQGCPHPATINDADGQQIGIPGLVADCFVMDATLASTLECYYDQSCLSLLHSSLSNIVHPLSDTLNKHFTRNSTVQALLNRIMIDEITSDVRFDSFYSQCSPAYCFYSYVHRFDVLFVVTTIIGIFGGVSFVLRIVAKLLAAMILRWKNRHMPRNDMPHGVVPQQRKRKLFIWDLRVRVKGCH